MNTFLVPVLIVAVIGILAGLILAFAAKFMAVEVDERFDVIRACLPGANCGACGFAGCDAYANALLGGGVATNLCPPGGAQCAKDLSNAMGMEFVETVPNYAIVRCNGTKENTEKLTEYTGPKTCLACASQYGGDGVCSFACMGYGDCVTVCAYDAIHVINGVAVVDKDTCVACGLCVKACPKNIITMAPATSEIAVTCSSKEKGAVTRKACKVGCIGCKKCEKACQFDAIHVVDNVASIDPEKCTNCGACVTECPTNAINYTDCSKCR